jgi:hypothetical protein
MPETGPRKEVGAVDGFTVQVEPLGAVRQAVQRAVDNERAALRGQIQALQEVLAGLRARNALLERRAAALGVNLEEETPQ